MVYFLLGLIVGIQVGYWAWALRVWASEVVLYLKTIRQNSSRDPSVVVAPTIQPINQHSPNVVKPKTPKQIALEKLNTLRRNDR